MLSLGMDIGTSTVRLVLLRDGAMAKQWMAVHHGRPFACLKKGLSALELDADTPFSLCVTGSNTEDLLEQAPDIPSFGDIPAVVEGVRQIVPQAGSVIEIGSQGARFITDLQSRAPQFAVNEHCAGGTGSFFEDQMSRVGCKLEDYSSLVEQAQSVPRLSGRCAVFAKTDIIHRQQEGAATPDILLGLCYAMIRNYKATIVRRLPVCKPVVFCGGVTCNTGVIRAIREVFGLTEEELIVAFFEEATAPMRNVIEINHCRVGRYECSFGANSCCYLAAGDFAVCAAARKKSSSCFPLRHYHGITILLDLDAISPEMWKQMEWYGVDLDVIRRYICTENRCCILRSEPTIAHIFSELYTAHSVPDTGYLRLKVLELLHILTRLKNREDVQQTEYFNQHQVECVKQAAALLTQELTVHRTIEQLAQEVGLSPTALKSCFKGIYGSSVYAYQKEYRLQLAQKLLLETDCTVAEIAHRVGYENPNKFSSAFREAAGMTPTEYRKMRPIG